MAKNKKFSGNYQDLQNKVALIGFAGSWTDYGNHKKFNAENGAFLNWWESTKTINFQGKPESAQQFETAFFETERT